jgi:cellulose biosynthesis protein BcsQ
MAKVLTFFNHKGGVGKTTLAYNIAWGLSEKGKRVLMIDADAQCNLTEITIEDKHLYGDDQLSLIENDYPPDFFSENNIYEYLSPYIQPTLGMELPKTKLFNRKKNLQLLTGSIKFAELEDPISLSTANVPGMTHIPQSVYTALQELSKGFECVIIDLSPALSATNRLFLMLSDYFIVPVNPSIFSQQALENLNIIFRDWNKKLSGFEIFSRKIKVLPKLLGIVCQNYRPFSRKDEENTKSAKRFGERLDKLNSCATELAEDLNSFGMAITPKEFNNVFVYSLPYRIAKIPDYNQLAQISESEKIPVIGLDNKILNKNKINTKEYREKVEDFQKECSLIVDGLLKIL